MTSVWVNGLSSTNLSGRQVVCGHLSELLRSAKAGHRFTLLVHPENRDVVEMLDAEGGFPDPSRLVIEMAPWWTRHWVGRGLYERLWLPVLMKARRAEVCLHMSGMVIRGLGCRQVTLALNPWALVDTGHRGWSSRFKAMLQRRGYRLAVSTADAIGYGSEFMKALYEAEAGQAARCSAVVYPAFGRREIQAMDEAATGDVARDRYLVLCVSLMAPHKNLEGLIRAVEETRRVHGVPARLMVAGGWADQAYRERMARLVQELGLEEVVTFSGYLERKDLYVAYRKARVYALMSRSESFGIPAVEAQRMGTPVLGALGSAMPEVGGAGGVFVDPDDVAGAAGHLARLLSDDPCWEELSRRARENSLRFEYRKTSAPLFAMLGLHE
ncbi:MAG TPA: glycosyltransferase [Kiritimatiellia bacterium]|nr:glycosyltransferase [Kiritimatiellia bacterium]